ncbi:TauD/TfdA family dioxygenase [Nocardia sp. NPDC088792]|uniref:TauD/TfdA family dioxygenase n=1 Tax=Nocardia sp. NPDC088792 TaxID=3364332 RepID=UPI003819A90E
MSWPSHVVMTPGTRTALVEFTDTWSIQELEQPDVQQRALTEARAAVPGLETLLSEAIDAVHRTGAVIVGGFPGASAALVVFASALGEVNAAFNGPEPGTLVHDLVAVADRQRRADPPHNDSVFLERPHAYIGLVCVRPSSSRDGLTMLIRAGDLEAALLERGVDVSLLRDPCFPFAEPDPKDPEAGEPAVHLRPLLSGTGASATVLWRPTRVRAGLEMRPDALDAAHRAALDAFAAALEDPALATLTMLDEGDLLLLDNRGVLHGRTPIAAGGQDRHLKRVKIHA